MGLAGRQPSVNKVLGFGLRVQEISALSMDANLHANKD